MGMRTAHCGTCIKTLSIQSNPKGMEELERSSRVGIGNGGVRVKFLCLESGMEGLGLGLGLGLGISLQRLQQLLSYTP